MDVVKAASELYKKLEHDGRKPIRDIDGRSLGHAAWMLQGICMGYVEGDKAHRWLGYAQAVVVCRGLAELHEMQTINMNS